MNTRNDGFSRNRRGGPMRDARVVSRGVVAGLALATLALAGCTDFLNDLVSVDAPDRITASTYEVPENVPTMTAGMVADFECALSNYVLAAGIAGDELQITDALTAPEMLDKRQWETRGLGAAWGVSTCNSYNEATPPIYRPMSTARWQADNLLTLLQGWTDAKAAAYAGYALTILGEVMCTVPLDVGPALQPAAVFAEAQDRFTTAITAATTAGASADEFLNMARIGMGRALLDAGDAAGAAAAVQSVPAGFVKNAAFSTTAPRRYNAIYDYVQGNTTTIDPSYRAMQFSGVDDPRIPVFDTGRLTPGVNIELWDQTKYPGRDAAIPIARYAEVQLIMAEAAVAANDLPTAVNMINALHTAASLPSFSSSDATEIMNQIIYERQAEFFLEGQRFGDMWRYNVTLDPAPGTPYHTGGSYQDNRCFPIPGIETDANPNVS
jgi:hypothetical protein